MSRLRRVATAMTAALALSAPAFADTAPPAEPPASAAPGAVRAPSGVVIRIDGGFRPQNRWLWYDGDGTARFEGVLASRRGRFRAHVDYAKVEKLLAETNLCAAHETLVRPAAMDVFTYHLSVRCGERWRLFTSYDALRTPGDAPVREAVRGLERLAANLSWEPTTETIPVPNALGWSHSTAPGWPHTGGR